MPDTLLGDLSPETFLNDYWQKQPLLIRDALPDFASPLSPNELAGLACEETVTSRIILERGGRYPWELRYGPFDADDFATLPETHWTLLVQEVDRLVPAAADLMERVRFIPNWRLDDLQVSYAPEHGTVGAHVDSYDVFLLQGLGHRRWQIHHDPVPPDEEAFVPDLDVRILQDFEPDAEWVLGPGDVLYLPPRVPHYGVALDDSMTYSVGFKAPSALDLATGFLAHLTETFTADTRYCDPDLSLQAHPGELHPNARAKLRTLLRNLMRDDDRLDRWLGRYVTAPQRGTYTAPPDEPYTPDELVAALRQGARLRRSAVAHFAYVECNDETYLYACGTEYPLSPGLAFAAPLISGTAPLTEATLAPHFDHEACMDLLADLVNEGYLLVE